MGGNDTETTELDRLQTELLQFLVDQTALGALDSSQVQISQKVVDAIASQVDAHARNAVASELAGVRAALADRAPVRHNRPDSENDVPPIFVSPPPSEGEPLAGLKKREKTGAESKNRFLAILEAWLLPVVACLAVAAALGSLWQLEQTKEKLRLASARAEALCKVQQDILIRIDRPESSAAADAKDVPPQRSKLSGDLHDIIDDGRNCLSMKTATAAQDQAPQ